ncbi:Phospholipase/carboxylesterase [Annulohypoxylon nitens]|nr:Phospholipase/carboxylesterase [Annulohypoxylon nitens]KAI1445581.1 Phospholipase/carboxylesterase [Annulohypoxylon stygium]
MLTPLSLPKSILLFVLFLFVVVAFASIKSNRNSHNHNPTMAMRRAPPLLFPAAAKHTATVIFVHGLGDTGHGWASAVENWRRRQRLDEVKFILPHAPRISVTAAEGMFMPGWYDIFALSGKTDDIRKDQDERGILLSREYFNGLIQAEIDAGIPASRIVLGGFSQGGAISLFTGLTSKYKLAGIVALSSYLLLDSKFPDFVKENDNNHKTPVLMCHGDEDQVVPTNFGKVSYELLKSQGFDVTMKIYPGMAHSACVEELDEVEAFLGARLPAEGDKKSEL